MVRRRQVIPRSTREGDRRPVRVACRSAPPWSATARSGVHVYSDRTIKPGRRWCTCREAARSADGGLSDLVDELAPAMLEPAVDSAHFHHRLHAVCDSDSQGGSTRSRDWFGCATVHRPCHETRTNNLRSCVTVLAFGAAASICMPAARSTSEGLQVSKGNAFGFALRQGTTSSLNIPCAWGVPSRPRSSRGRISATYAVVIRMCKRYGVQES